MAEVIIGFIVGVVTGYAYMYFRTQSVDRVIQQTGEQMAKREAQLRSANANLAVYAEELEDRVEEFAKKLHAEQVKAAQVAEAIEELALTDLVDAVLQTKTIASD